MTLTNKFFSSKELKTNLALALILTVCSIVIRYIAFSSTYYTADDVVHLPSGHLISYRPLMALDLYLCQLLFGHDYLLTSKPLYTSHIWLLILCFAYFKLIENLTLSNWSKLSIGLILVSSPLLNPNLVWNVFTFVTFSYACCLYAFYLANKDRPSNLLSILFLLFSLLTYQVSFGIYLSLFVISIIYETNIKSMLKHIYRNCLIISCAVLCFFIYISLSKALGTSSWGGRGVISLEHLFSVEGLSQKWHTISNFIANIYQPSIGLFISNQAAIKYGLYSHFILSLALGIVTFFVTKNIALSFRMTSAFILAVLACAAALLPIHPSPSGLRVEGPAIVAICYMLALGVNSFSAINPNKHIGLNVIALIFVGFVISINTITTRQELDIRIQGYHVDQYIVNTMKKHIAINSTKTLTESTFTIEDNRDRRINTTQKQLIVNYNPLKPLGKSNIVNGFTKQFLEHNIDNYRFEIEKKVGLPSNNNYQLLESFHCGDEQINLAINEGNYLLSLITPENKMEYTDKNDVCLRLT